MIVVIMMAITARIVIVIIILARETQAEGESPMVMSAVIVVELLRSTVITNH